MRLGYFSPSNAMPILKGHEPFFSSHRVMEEINATYGFVATKYELIIELKLLINYRSNNIYLDSFLYISLRLLCRSEL